MDRRGVLLVLACALLSGCGRADAPAPTTMTVTVPLRQSEVPQTTPPARAGHLLLHVLAARCGIISVTGTHAEFLPKDPLCRVRLRVVDDDATAHTFLTGPSQLLTRSGRALPLSTDGMTIGRQPDEVPLGAHDAAELDLWWTVPPGEQPLAVRLAGDTDEDVQGTSVQPAGARLVDVPLDLG